MPANLNDLAKRLNVSVATVSRALNDKPGVGSEMRQKVLALADELGFVPNMTARSLVTARTQTVGFVIRPFDQPLTADPFYFPMLMAIEEELISHDYHILLNSINEESVSTLRMVEQSRVDGLILTGPNLNAQFVTLICNSGFPVVLIDNKPEHSKANTILTDDTGGAAEATAHLISHGHTRIAHIGGPAEWVSNRMRFNGYQAAMREAGLQDYCQVVRKPATTVATGEEAAAELLRGPNPPTAIFAVNDSMAVGAARAAAALGLSIPEDLALVGFDNIPVAEHFMPPLTTVRIYKEQMGKMAARRILEVINDPGGAPVETIVSTELIIRNSCGCS
ncbi:MAG TPA: LacI family DNA-binding transcriptional regulator [Chloroflexia bacterium]|nr:LacI family DNA-binding transcriptional regulator [Chloroflexia bacterium]